MKTLELYLKKYRVDSILAPVFKLLEACIDLLVPLVVARILNDGVATGNKNVIVHMVLLLILLAFVGMAFSFVAQYFAARASVGCCTDLRQSLFDHIQSFSYGTLDTLGTDTLLTRVTADINQIQNGLNLALRLLLRSPFVVFGAMIMAFTINTKAALVFVVAIPLLFVVVFWIMLSTIPRYKSLQSALDRLVGKVRENLTGVRVIRAFRKEEDEVQDFAKENKIYTRMNEAVGRLSALMNPLTYALINLAIVVLIQVSAGQVDTGKLAQGDVVALYNYMAQILTELIKMASLMITIDKSVACAQRVETVMNTPAGMSYPDTPVTESNEESSLSFENVSFAYPGSQEDAVQDISFHLKKGQTLGIIGPTGSGKSTIADLAARYYDPRKGIVKVDGVDVKKYQADQLVHKIGMVPQKAVLFAGTVRDNMRIGSADADDENIWRALEAAQVKDVIEAKEGQLDYVVEQGGKNLSGGQRQRLTIARALVKKPEILVLDDSASALDFATDAKLRQALHDWDPHMITIMISQRTSSIRYADMILVMDDGKAVGEGTHEQLMKTCPMYQEIYYSQFPEEKVKSTVEAA